MGFTYFGCSIALELIACIYLILTLGFGVADLYFMCFFCYYVWLVVDVLCLVERVVDCLTLLIDCCFVTLAFILIALLWVLVVWFDACCLFICYCWLLLFWCLCRYGLLLFT